MSREVSDDVFAKTSECYVSYLLYKAFPNEIVVFSNSFDGPDLCVYFLKKEKCLFIEVKSTDKDKKVVYTYNWKTVRPDALVVVRISPYNSIRCALLSLRDKVKVFCSTSRDKQSNFMKNEVKTVDDFRKRVLEVLQQAQADLSSYDSI